MPRLPELILKKNEDRRLRAGHLWVYSNEVDIRATPLAGFAPGSLAIIKSAGGRSLGTGYVNPHSLICARLVSQHVPVVLDTAFLEHRIRTALRLREALYEQPFYRLVYGEGDGLPGLVVDRYGEVLVIQLTTAGMEQCKDAIVEALERVLAPRAMMMRNDTAIRRQEHLELYTEMLGDVPEQVSLKEGGGVFEVPLREGQKTGWFYDQRNNRQAMHKYVRGKRVLDVFSYTGAWGIQAALAGAATVGCIESSPVATAMMSRNLAANRLGDTVTVHRGDAFELLKELRDARERFDVVIVDPPAFIKRRKDIRAGEEGYNRLNRLAIQLLGEEGILISCSCSGHLAETRLQKILLQSSRHPGRQLQILERGFQAPDHPVHPAIAETAYLKALFCRVFPDRD